MLAERSKRPAIPEIGLYLAYVGLVNTAGGHYPVQSETLLTNRASLFDWKQCLAL